MVNRWPDVTIKSPDEGIVELTLDDKATRNRMDTDFDRKLTGQLDELSGDDRMKVLIFRGRPDVFCGGGTLAVLQELARPGGKMSVADFALPDRLLSFPVPIVAAMEGDAVGGGFGLALCCDILIGASQSRYGFNFVELGFTPGYGVTRLLPAMVGHHFAIEMLATAKLYLGAELSTVGLFNRVVPRENVSSVATEIAQRIAEKPRHVLKALKQNLSIGRRRSLMEAIPTEAWMQQMCFRDPKTLERIQSEYLP